MPLKQGKGYKQGRGVWVVIMAGQSQRSSVKRRGIQDCVEYVAGLKELY